MVPHINTMTAQWQCMQWAVIGYKYTFAAVSTLSIL